MRLFIDEDTGSSLAKALQAVGVDADCPGGKHSIIKWGDDDTIWIPHAGKSGMLVLSRNTNIVLVEAERQLLVSESVGIVFLPQHLTKLELLRLVMKKWDWLEKIDGSEARPFAFRVYPSGNTVRLSLTASPRRRVR